MVTSYSVSSECYKALTLEMPSLIDKQTSLQRKRPYYLGFLKSLYAAFLSYKSQWMGCYYTRSNNLLERVR